MTPITLPYQYATIIYYSIETCQHTYFFFTSAYFPPLLVFRHFDLQLHTLGDKIVNPFVIPFAPNLVAVNIFSRSSLLRGDHARRSGNLRRGGGRGSACKLCFIIQGCMVWWRVRGGGRRSNVQKRPYFDKSQSTRKK